MIIKLTKEKYGPMGFILINQCPIPGRAIRIEISELLMLPHTVEDDLLFSALTFALNKNKIK